MYENITFEKIATYDIEVLPNIFTCVIAQGKKLYVYELSERKNNLRQLIKHLTLFKVNKIWMCGFNNITYDYQILHFLLLQSDINSVTTTDLYNKSKALFNVKDKLRDIVWEHNHIIPQIDLFRMMHFNNKAKSASLKKLQCNMRLKNIVEHQGSFDDDLPLSEFDELIKYNKSDVMATRQFLKHVWNDLQYRVQESIRSGDQVISTNSVKIGEKYLVNKLIEKVGIKKFYNWDSGSRKKVQTIRGNMSMNDLILPKIKFEDLRLQEHVRYLRTLTVYAVKGKFHWSAEKDFLKNLKNIYSKNDCRLTAEQKKQKKERDDVKIPINMDGFIFEFGKGGLHGCVKPSFQETDEEWQIIDVDVVSYYASISTTANIYPAHIGREFCQVFEEERDRRQQFAKGTVENATIKQALTGSFGNTNSEFSELFDPKYLIKVTVNGQLMLLMLFELISKACTLSKIIQANTDGLTFRVHRSEIEMFREACNQWEEKTGLELEHVKYDWMAVRDVNNYLAKDESGKIKMKGTYAYNILYTGDSADGIQRYKNHSNIVIKKAVYEYLVNGRDPEEYILQHKDVWDFFKCTPANRSYQNYLTTTDDPTLDEILASEKIQRVSRYYVSNEGKYIKRYSEEERKVLSVEAKYKVTVVNRIVSENIEDYDINYDYYIEEMKKILVFKK